MKKDRGALGRGLASILGNSVSIYKNTEKEKQENHVSSILGIANKIPIDQIVTNPFQPRKNFNTEKLNEIATSIEKLGIIQPITVRKLKDKEFQLISGERRFRASKMIGLEKIPAFVRIANDQEMLEMALVENIQRENLNPIEIALSYQRLIEEIKLTQEECSYRVGKKRSTITNFLRLLRLPNIIQKGLIDNNISNGHARALLAVQSEESQINLYYDIVENGYSVREVEQLAKEFSFKNYKRTSKKKQTNYIPTFTQQKIVHDISKKLNTNVELKCNKKGTGKLIIPFNNDQELDKIIKILKK